jgi:hypothetical protein
MNHYKNEVAKVNLALVVLINDLSKQETASVVNSAGVKLPSEEPAKIVISDCHPSIPRDQLDAKRLHDE